MPEAIQDQTRADQTRAENTLPQTAFADLRTGPAETKNPKPTEAQIEQLYALYPRRRDKLDAKKAIGKAVVIVVKGDADHPAMSVEDALDYLAQRVAAYTKAVRWRSKNPAESQLASDSVVKIENK